MKEVTRMYLRCVVIRTLDIVAYIVKWHQYAFTAVIEIEPLGTGDKEFESSSRI